MKIPKTLEIAGQEYKVVRLDQQDSVAYRGLVDHDKGEIYLSESLTPVSAPHTLMHEALHAMFFLGGYRDDVDEKLVYFLAQQLVTFLKHNRRQIMGMFYE